MKLMYPIYCINAVLAFFNTYRRLNRELIYWLLNTVFCQIYRVTDEALIAETMVWPNYFLMNVFVALKGSKLFIIISKSLLISLQLDAVQCGGRKKSHRTHL